MERFFAKTVTTGVDVEVDTSSCGLHLSQACLTPDSRGSVTLLVSVGSSDEWFPVCTLRAGQVDFCALDLSFFQDDERVRMRLRGRGAIAVTGA